MLARVERPRRPSGGSAPGSDPCGECLHPELEASQERGRKKRGRRGGRRRGGRKGGGEEGGREEERRKGGEERRRGEEEGRRGEEGREGWRINKGEKTGETKRRDDEERREEMGRRAVIEYRHTGIEAGVMPKLAVGILAERGDGGQVCVMLAATEHVD
eukprot:763628-Hanusia_phi.AAC.1